MLAGNIILPLDFRVVEERMGKIMMRPSAFLGYPKGEMTLARAPGFAATLADGSVLAPARAFIAAVASLVEIGILRGHLITKTKKGQRREIVLDAAESAARRGEIRRRRRRRWNAVLPDNCA
jgi:hypothetical protein